MIQANVIVRSGIVALLLFGVACDDNMPTAPESSTPGPEGAAIAITSSGLSPSTVSISAGQSVTFRNDDSIAHEIVSGPVPSYDACPSINVVGRLEPGQSKLTAALPDSRSCGFLDLLRTSDSRWQGTITVQ
jgi:plastocyanin